MSTDLGNEGAGVRITGFVEKKFTPPSRKCVFVTVSFPSEKPGKRTKVDLVAFGDLIPEADALGQGEKVTITAALGQKKLTNKARADVQVDGRDVWVLQLVIRTIKTEGAKPKAATDDKATWGDEPKTERPRPGATLPGDVIDGDSW